MIDARCRERIAGLLAHNDELQATSIMRVLRAEGFDGWYRASPANCATSSAVVPAAPA